MKELSVQQQALLELVKIGIGTSDGDFDFKLLSSEDWKLLMDESKAHTVQLMAYDSAKSFISDMPEEVNKEWFMLCAKTIAQTHRVLKSQNVLIDLLDANSFDYIILKGFAAASYYPDFMKRCYGDVDFLIDPAKQQEIEDMLKSNGYECVLENYVCHSVFRKPGSDLEMHYEVAGIPNGEKGDIFRKYFEGATDKYFNNDNPKFRNPQPEIHSVIILLHTIHHLIDQGLGLRHLCDWACFVDKTYNHPFWEETVIPLLKQTGTFKIAAALSKTCSLYLGTKCPEWALDEDKDLCLGIILDILDLGNFGRRNAVRSVSGLMISQRGVNGIENRKFSYITAKFGSIWKRACSSTKIKLFAPFTFVWLMVKNSVLMLMGKKTSILKTNSYANERKSIYEQFELFD